jgi:hypothetical protein
MDGWMDMEHWRNSNDGEKPTHSRVSTENLKQWFHSMRTT